MIHENRTQKPTHKPDMETIHHVDRESLPLCESGEQPAESAADRPIRHSVAVVESQPRVSENGRTPSAVPAPSPPDDPARFDLRYVHSGFTCKEVPYLHVKRAFDILISACG